MRNMPATTAIRPHRSTSTIRTLTALLLLACLAGTPLVVTAADQPVCADTRLESEIAAWREAHGVRGVVVACFDADTAGFLAVGTRDGQQPLAPDHVFQGGQLANLLTALAVHSLIDEATLQSAQNVHDLARELDFQNPWEDERPILVEHLLAHESGLPALHFKDLFFEEAGQTLLADLNRALRDMELVFPPGQQQRFSQAGYGIAAYLVDRSPDLSYEDALELLFAALDLAPAATASAAATDGSGSANAGETQTAVLGSAANLAVTPEALARLGQVLLREGDWQGRQLIDRDVIARLEARRQDYIPSYTAGARLEAGEGFPFHVVSGAYPGYAARLAWSRELGRGYLLLANSRLDPAALGTLDQQLKFAVIGTDRQDARPAFQAVDSAAREVLRWQAVALNPVDRFLRGWADVATLSFGSEDRATWSPLLGRPATWRLLEGELLRVEGDWWPSRQLIENRQLLVAADERWTRLGRLEFLAYPVIGLLALLAIVFTAGHAPFWLYFLLNHQLNGYHQWLPRLVPVVGALLALGLLLLLSTASVGALGQLSTRTVGITVLTMLLPLAAVLSVAATVAGLQWRISRRASARNVIATLALLVASGWLIECGLFAWQSWNY